MTPRSKTIKTAIVACIVILLAANASAIGVSPGSIKFQNLVRGGYAEKSLLVSNAGSEDLVIKIESSGSIKEWLTFEPKEEEIVVQKRSSTPIMVRINVPNTVQNGVYEGDVVISSLYVGGDTLAGGSGARFMPGLIVRVQLTVSGEEISSYEIKSILVKDTEQTYPVEFNINIENTGNVIVTPKLRIRILDSEGKETGKVIAHNDTSILPTIVKQFSIKMPTKGMDVGGYYAQITSDRGDEQTVFFQIMSLGTLAVRGNLEQLTLNKIWVNPGETVKLEGTFINEGEIFIESAKLRGEVYRKETGDVTKELAGVFEGDALSVRVGDSAVLTAYFTPKESGTYSIEGFVVFSGKKSEVKSSILNVLAEKTNYTIYYFLGGGLVLVSIVLYLTRKADESRAMRVSGAEYVGPITRSAAKNDIYGTLAKELKAMKKDSVSLVSVDSQDETETVSSLLRIFINERGMNGVYVSVSKPYEEIMQEMRNAQVKTDRLFFIDCISHMAGKVPEKTENAIFIENPSSLEEINMYIDKMFMKISGQKFIIIDSLSSMLIYNNERSVEEFTHLIISKMRLEKVGGVIISIKQKGAEELVKTLTAICDKKIVL